MSGFWAGQGLAPGLVLLAGQACAVAEYLVHARVFHRPGTPHAAWWASRPPGFRRAASAAGLAYWLAVFALCYSAPAAALILTWGWVLGYGALLIARRGSARIIPESPGTGGETPVVTPWQVNR